MESLKVRTGKAIRRLRKAAKLSAEKLAELTGAHPNSIYQLERGENWISPELLTEICRVLKLSPGAIFDAANEPETNAGWTSRPPERFDVTQDARGNVTKVQNVPITSPHQLPTHEAARAALEQVLNVNVAMFTQVTALQQQVRDLKAKIALLKDPPTDDLIDAKFSGGSVSLGVKQTSAPSLKTVPGGPVAFILRIAPTLDDDQARLVAAFLDGVARSQSMGDILKTLRRTEKDAHKKR